ncbi:hypothetical protein DICVIV_03472 [Dictyocaulus viviparus]|uniref:Major facilitator superfamily (MFS) profile domain-containing protein n=1 Tax=Dictyocaulus viviparus TaxID=29172 RepID=A0A0D8Y2J8_DICVI|nr:hypothetical protein DICVIV_03472 [Dictyocaulus viviparus]
MSLLKTLLLIQFVYNFCLSAAKFPSPLSVIKFIMVSNKDNGVAKGISKPETSNESTAKTPWSSIYISGLCSFVQAAQFSIFFSSMWPYLRKLNSHAEETQYGYIVALYSVGQCISAPTFGYWSNRIEQIRLPLLTGFCLMMIGNVFYLSLQFFVSTQVTIAMGVARFIAGSGTGNMSLLRAYASTSSSKSDRSRAIACSFQLLFTPLGSDGVNILSFYQLNIYNAPALFSLILNVLGFLLILFIFEERYDVLLSAAAKEKNDLPSPCIVAVMVCVTTRFVQIFTSTTIETLGSPFSMLMFLFTKEEAVAANSSAHLAAGSVGVTLYFIFIFFDLSKW